MNLVLLAHPLFLGLRSQDHFARMLAEAFAARGHRVTVRRPVPRARAWAGEGRLAKWAGYVDQYLLFPRQLRRAMRRDPPDTLYVVCDQALGPWVPLVAARPHVVHCHDLLALQSAQGDWPQNPVSITGRKYQRWIRRGFSRARHFVSISHHTRTELHRLTGLQAVTSEVVHLGLNHPYAPMHADEARACLRQAGLPVPEGPVLLHVGGGQWYKNSVGVVALYCHHVLAAVQAGQRPLALWMVSPPRGPALQALLAQVPAAGRVQFIHGVSPDALQALYGLAAALLFPSLAEGFGWPILEAMACGCAVFTTGEAPMTEVGGEVAHYLPRLHADDALEAWAADAARHVTQCLQASAAERQARALAGVRRAAGFQAATAIEAYLGLYRQILALEGQASEAAGGAAGGAAGRAPNGPASRHEAVERLG